MAQSRRKLLAAASAAGIACVAGCSMLPTNSDTGTNETGTGDKQESTLSGDDVPSGYSLTGVESLFEALQHIETQLITTDTELYASRSLSLDQQTVSEEEITFTYNTDDSLATLSRQRVDTTADDKQVESVQQIQVDNTTLTSKNQTREFRSHKQAVTTTVEGVLDYVEEVLESISLEAESRPQPDRIKFAATEIKEEPNTVVTNGPVTGTYTITPAGNLVTIDITIGSESDQQASYQLSTVSQEE